jgi:hypothetical protein
MAGYKVQNNARAWLRRLLASGLWLWCSAAAFSQQNMVREQTILADASPQAAAPDTSITSALVNIASRASVAFTGRITKLERSGDVLEVSFLVEQALLGNPSGIYIVREWAGLSPLGQSHYVLGERIAVFLHAPGKSGLSSPVDGQEGIVPIVQASADQAPLLDLRRMATRVGRAMRQPLTEAETSAIALNDAKTLLSRSRPVRFDPVRCRLPFPIAHPGPVELNPARLNILHNNIIFDRPVAQ